MPPKRKVAAAKVNQEASITKKSMDGNTEETPKHPESENITQDQSTQTEASECDICEKYSNKIQYMQECEKHMAVVYQMMDQQRGYHGGIYHFD